MSSVTTILLILQEQLVIVGDTLEFSVALVSSPACRSKVSVVMQNIGVLGLELKFRLMSEFVVFTFVKSFNTILKDGFKSNGTQKLKERCSRRR